MNSYDLTITVKASTREEAEAKLQLLVQTGAFLNDFDATALGLAYLKYKAYKYLGDTYKTAAANQKKDTPPSV
jgi:glucokinase